jgi:hypothetical protein
MIVHNIKQSFLAAIEASKIIVDQSCYAVSSSSLVVHGPMRARLAFYQTNDYK